MKLYTIGFTKKSARQFFNLLRNRPIRKVIDIRLNNSSQLAGFSKGSDLEYFLDEICGIKYEHDISLSPTKEILDNYKNKKITWLEYEKQFNDLMKSRDMTNTFNQKTGKNYDGICLLCSEETSKNCHRRLVAELIKKDNPEIDLEIVHL